VGYAYRLAHYFTDASQRQFTARFSALFFSLCVLTFFALSRRLWDCQAAGLFAAFLIAFCKPVIAVTNGHEFLHDSYAVLLVSLHLALFVAYVKRPRPLTATLAALTMAAMLAAWEPAPYYAAAIAIAALVAGKLASDARRTFLTTHLLGCLLAGATLPWLRASRFLFVWTWALILVSTSWFYVRAWLPKTTRSALYIATGTVVLAALFRPFHLGALPKLSALDYWIPRLRFLLGKPADPHRLSDAARYLWTLARMSPDKYAVFTFFLPFLFILPVSLLAARDRATGSRRLVGIVLGIVVIAVGLFLLDRRGLLAAALGLFVLASVAGYGFGSHLKTRFFPVAGGTFLIVMQALLPYSWADIPHQAASVLGLRPDSPNEFLWISLGNADQSLVKYVVSRTSVRDPILTPPAEASLLTTFAGRKATGVPGLTTRADMASTEAFVSAFYRDEDSLYAFCDSLGITYVLYSIDFVLDETASSPRYLAGLSTVPQESAAFRMHFAPETLTHFNLVFENDNYRLYRVTREAAPTFLTDHPVVYQGSIAQAHGDNLRAFYNRVIDILVTFQTAQEAQAAGNDREAIRRFRYCLDQAPHFTAAWLRAGDSLLRLGNIQEANAAYTHALQNAPDNPEALFSTALTLARLNRSREALGMLDVLQSSTTDRDILKRAEELRAIIKSSGAPKDSTRSK
jgi:hypothetical protein